jgi:hypothetical protein
MMSGRFFDLPSATKGRCPLTPPETFLEKGFWTSKNFVGNLWAGFVAVLF